MRKAIVVLTLAAALAAGRPSSLTQVWTLLTSIWSNAGCGFDPSGQCAPAPQPDEGCGFDPSGCPKGS